MGRMSCRSQQLRDSKGSKGSRGSRGSKGSKGSKGSSRGNGSKGSTGGIACNAFSPLPILMPAWMDCNCLHGLQLPAWTATTCCTQREVAALYQKKLDKDQTAANAHKKVAALTTAVEEQAKVGDCSRCSQREQKATRADHGPRASRTLVTGLQGTGLQGYRVQAQGPAGYRPLRGFEGTPVPEGGNSCWEL